MAGDFDAMQPWLGDFNGIVRLQRFRTCQSYHFNLTISIVTSIWIPVFGLLKRGGKVYAVVIANAKATTLLPILKERIVPDSIVYSDSLPSYNALDVSGFRHL